MKTLLTLLGVAQAIQPGSRFKSMVQKLQARNANAETASMVAGVFDVAGFDESETEGKIGMKVCTHSPTKIHLSKSEQQSSWIRISDSNSPMESGKWKPAANGFRLENEQGEQIHCAAMSGKEVSDALLLEFQCESHDATSSALRFAKVSTSFWQPCPDGHVPYGWPSHWGAFDFPYSAVTDQGFIGCASVTSDGYCIETRDGDAIHANFGYNDSPSNKPVSLFPYDNFHAADLLPGSRFYTSTQPHRGLVTEGTTTSSQPAIVSSDVPSTPSVTISSQPVPPPPVPDTTVIALSASSPPFQVGGASRFRTQGAAFSTSSPPFVFKFEKNDDIGEKAQAAARKAEEEDDE